MHVALPLLAALLASGPSAETVVVRRAPALVERRTWDPANPPPALRRDGDRDATTDLRYRCSARLDVRTLSERDTGSEMVLELEIEGVQLDLKLEVVEHLPASPSAALVAHEEGHRHVGEAFYADGEARARRMAQAAIGRRFEARGVDRRRAVDAAVREAARALGQAWVDDVLARSTRAQEAYDAITNHGLNDSPTAEEALLQVLDEHLLRESAGP